jgi:hypothetical protein
MQNSFACLNSPDSFVESYVVVHKNKLLDIGSGSLCAVEFDSETIGSKIKELKVSNEYDPNTLLFICAHHENMGTAYSDADAECMESLNRALGVPIHFYIVCFPNGIFDIGKYIYDRGQISVEKDVSLDIRWIEYLQILSYCG